MRVVIKSESGGEQIKLMMGFCRGGRKGDVHLHQGKAPGLIIIITIIIIIIYFIVIIIIMIMIMIIRWLTRMVKQCWQR